MRTAILGLGLVGGSIARVLAATGDATGAGGGPRLVAWTPSGAGPRAALTAGVIDEAAASLAAAVTAANLVILAAPPGACLALLDELDSLRDRLAPDALITDVASTKVAIVRAAEALGLPFVGGHPMAGRESTGFGSASAELFRDRPWVVVPAMTAPPGAAERVDALAEACGARPVRLDAVTHDAAVAGISHLPLIVSAALVEAVAGAPGAPDRDDWAVARRLASTGWAGMTRLALGSPEMGADIALTNVPAIVARLADLQRQLDAWIVLLEGEPDPAAVLERFRAARDRLAGRDDGSA